MNIYNLNQDIYVTIPFLKKYSVKEKTINNGLLRNRQGKSIHYFHIKHPLDKRKCLIQYKTISYEVFSRYSLPPEYELFDIAVTFEKDLVGLTRSRLQLAYDVGYIKKQKNYKGSIYDYDLIKSFARTEAIFNSIIESNEFYKVHLKDLFMMYQEFSDLQFNTKSLKSFYNKVNQFKHKKHTAFLHGSLGLTKSNYRLTEEHIKEIRRLYKKTTQLSYRQIHFKLNSWAILNGFSRVSISSVKKVLCDPVLQNECKPIRNGKAWEIIYKQPYKLRENVKNNGDLWQLDGSKFQFPFNNNGKVDYLRVFVVMDVHSRKIVGHSISRSEDHKMIIKSIENAILNTGYIPDEMVIDNAKPFNHKNFKSLELSLGILGTYIRRHKVKHPQDKGHVERFFNTFQSTVCKGVKGYIGEGVKTKRENGKPSEEVLKGYKKRKNLRTKEELILLFHELIAEYNNLQINPSNPSPNIKFATAKSPNASFLSDNEKALMFWCYGSVKVDRSCITLSEGSYRDNEFHYIIYNEDIVNRLNGQFVHIRYLKEDRSIIKIFDENEEFITDLKLEKKIYQTGQQKRITNELLQVQNIKKTIGRMNLDEVINQHENLFQNEGTLEVFTLKAKESKIHEESKFKDNNNIKIFNNEQ